MFLAITPKQYDPHFIMLSEKTKNNVLNGGDFYRLYYSDEEATYNGLYVAFALQNTTVEKYFNKIKCCFSQKENRQVIEAIKGIEKSILAQAPDAENKHSVHRMEEQLNNDYIKLFTEVHPNYGSAARLELLLKVSGIWSNANEYGITFRFFFIHR
jgi:hypothetical protein